MTGRITTTPSLVVMTFNPIEVSPSQMQIMVNRTMHMNRVVRHPSMITEGIYDAAHRDQSLNWRSMEYTLPTSDGGTNVIINVDAVVLALSILEENLVREALIEKCRGDIVRMCDEDETFGGPDAMTHTHNSDNLHVRYMGANGQVWTMTVNSHEGDDGRHVIDSLTFKADMAVSIS